MQVPFPAASRFGNASVRHMASTWWLALAPSKPPVPPSRYRGRCWSSQQQRGSLMKLSNRAVCTSIRLVAREDGASYLHALLKLDEPRRQDVSGPADLSSGLCHVEIRCLARGYCCPTCHAVYGPCDARYPVPCMCNYERRFQ